MSEILEESDVYAIIGNIPPFYRSCNLRNYFSQFVETEGFRCFHFRHRPETRIFKNSEIKNNVPCQPSCVLYDNVNNASDGDETSSKSGAKKSSCCVIRISQLKLTELMKLYHEHHWLDKDGNSIRMLCFIAKIQVLDNVQDAGSIEYKTRGEQKLVPADRHNLTRKDLSELIELNPPALMPRGNVGTPTKYFLEQISLCKLPPSIIANLGLTFPKTRTNRRYGDVPFDYGNVVDEGTDHDVAISGSGQELESNRLAPLHESDEVVVNSGSNSCKGNNGTKSTSSKKQGGILQKSESHSDISEGGTCDDTSKSDINPKKVRRKGVKCEKKSESKLTFRTDEPDYAREERDSDSDKLNFASKPRSRSPSCTQFHCNSPLAGEPRSESGSDSDGGEEWDRHIAHNDDVEKTITRDKERVFEEPLEVVWEKGGSGLLFYTDAQHWAAQEGDFDEQTADDWDVDMAGYYEADGGDLDTQNFIERRRERRIRSGAMGNTLNSQRGIGAFEDFTKGVGRRLMEQRGWCEGAGLGAGGRGTPNALDNEGQGPYDRRGLGFHGEKLERPPKFGTKSGSARKRPRNKDDDRIISTAYDDPLETDPAEPLLRRTEKSYIKHRHDFVRPTDPSHK